MKTTFMKYPAQQFETLVSALKELARHFEVKDVNPCELHYIVFQQGSLGQTHNWLYTNGSEIKRAHSLSSLEGWQKVANVPSSFELYPDGCNDNHIETAVKRAISEAKRQAAMALWIAAK
jgi:hypothetical protein